MNERRNEFAVNCEHGESGEFLYSSFGNSQVFVSDTLNGSLNDCLFMQNNKYPTTSEQQMSNGDVYYKTSNREELPSNYSNQLVNAGHSEAESLRPAAACPQLDSINSSWQRNEAQCSSSVNKQSVKDSYLNALNTTTKTKTKKKVSRKKDVNKPPKPVSAYAHFFREKQTEIKSKNPEASFGEVSKIVASEWDSLPNETKVVYKKKADQEKQDYLRALATFKANVVAGNLQEDNGNGAAINNKDVTNQAEQSSLQVQTQTLHTENNLLNNYESNPDETWIADLEANFVWTPLPEVQTNNRVGDMNDNRCIRLGCQNASCQNPEWDNEYCSNDCAVIHCKDVFDAWLEARQSSVTSD